VSGPVPSKKCSFVKSPERQSRHRYMRQSHWPHAKALHRIAFTREIVADKGPIDFCYDR
jgi:hypothetical protein